MGYFKRKLDRSRSRRLVRTLNDSAGDAQPWQAIPERPPRAVKFVRFSARDLHAESRRRRGIFAAAGDVLDSPHVRAALARRLDAELDWFNEHLRVPDLDERRAIFLFKSSARENMRHIWVLLHTLRDAGVFVEMQTIAKPGRIVYEDEHQVAVIPWADAREL